MRESYLLDVPAGFRLHVEEHAASTAANAKTIVLVNGAIATTRSSAWATALLRHLRVVLYDAPHLGGSKKHNPQVCAPLSLQEEADMLLYILDHFRADYLASVSWGGLAALQALSTNPASVDRAVICSFSGRLSTRSRLLLEELLALVRRKDNSGAAALVNDTLGRYLPRRSKVANRIYLSALGQQERDHIAAHIERVLTLDLESFAPQLRAITAELLFINGQLDDFTDHAGAAELALLMKNARVAVLPDAGHFLAGEGHRKAEAISRLMHSFLAASRADLAALPASAPLD